MSSTKKNIISFLTETKNVYIKTSMTDPIGMRITKLVAKEKRRRGRPPKPKPLHDVSMEKIKISEAQVLYLDAMLSGEFATKEEIANHLGVGVSNLYRWERDETFTAFKNSYLRKRLGGEEDLLDFWYKVRTAALRPQKENAYMANMYATRHDPMFARKSDGTRGGGTIINILTLSSKDLDGSIRALEESIVGSISGGTETPILPPPAIAGPKETPVASERNLDSVPS